MDAFKRKRYLVISAIIIDIIIIITLISASLISSQSSRKDFGTAPGFQATDTRGTTFSLDDYAGDVVIIHITNIENPLCTECEKVLGEQTGEIEKLVEKRPDAVIITINIRKNPRSDPGDELAKRWWNTNVTWHWVEDFDPYPISGKYLQYWNLDSGTANPTILLVDKELRVVGVYHVYQMGKGEIDGVQTADSLDKKMTRLEQGTWEGLEGELSSRQTGFLGMFVLGMITSLSPCSIALLIAMLSYVMTATDGGKPGPDGSNVKKGMIIGTAFTLGMALVFFIMGLFISYIGVFVRASPFFYLAAGILLVILGVHNIRSLSEFFRPLWDHPLLKKKKAGRKKDRTFTERFTAISVRISHHSIALGAFVLGIFFAIGWAPCAISLILPVLIGMASQDVSMIAGALLLFTFGIGHGIIVIPITVASRSIRGHIGNRYVEAGKWVTKIFGAASIVIGIIFAGRYFGYYLW